jgi:retron-type reverse transcriptase
LAGASSAGLISWNAINWKKAEQQVRRLQVRIAKAVKEGRYGKVKSLQWLLSHSLSAKLIAVRRVTQNQGGKTAGVDNVVWTTPKQKMRAVISVSRNSYQPQPLKRIYIPKKNGKKRPLSIPTMNDRAQQALHLLTIEPVSETLADKNAYGFRPKRSCADAIDQCFKVLARKNSAQWILEGDIKSCFDKISHQWLSDNIPMDKSVLGKWLKAGYIEKTEFYPTEEGTPQGGIISKGHILVYLTSGFESFLEILKTFARERFIVYGCNRQDQKGCLQYKLPSRKGFLEDLRTCRAVMATSGFTLITESLHLHKPYLALPMIGQFEQEINAHFLARLGCGINLRNVRSEAVGNFLYHLPELTEQLADYPVEGNEKILDKLGDLTDNDCAQAMDFRRRRKKQ